jgi:PIN domain nuclease of toxin-antitoxin system
MKALLDTHAFLWWLAGDPALSAAARTMIGDEDSTIFVSAATAWEIATKHRLGKLPGAASIAPDIQGSVQNQGFMPLDVTMRHAQRAGALRGYHRDPFDRMLIAQAIVEDCTLISNEQVFDRYNVPRFW